jgi:hypothetical protein
MNATTPVQRDERTVAVQNAGYRWAYNFVAYALLIDVMCRSLLRREAAWDLLALVIAGGAVCTIYQARHKTLAHGWPKTAVLIACVAAAIAVALAIVLAVTQVM